MLRAALLLAGALLVMASASPALAQEEDLNEADAFMQRGELKKAAASYDRAIRKWPQQVRPAAYAQRARIFIIQKRYPAGLRWVQAVALKQHPGSAQIKEQQALMLWALGSRSDALRIAREVVSKRPQAYATQQILGESYSQRGQPQKAARALELYLKHRPEELSKNDVLPRVRLGFAYLSMGRASDAEKQFTTILQKHKNQPHAEVNANNGLCAAYTRMGKFDRAITLCERIVKNPENIDRVGSVWFNLGQAYLQKRRPRQAITVARQFTRMRRGEPKGYILIADAYFLMQDWHKALQFYQQAETRAGGRADIRAKLGIKMGTTLRRLGQVDVAIKKLEQAVADDADNALLASELAAAYIANQDDEKALATADRLLHKQPRNVDLLVIAGAALYNQKKHQQALDRYKAAYQVNPNERKIRLGLVQTMNYQAFQLLEADKLADAEKVLLDARRFDEDSPLTNRNLAVLALHRGQCERALGYLQPLSKLRGEALVYHRLAGRANLCKDEPDAVAAREHYKQAAQRAEGNKLMLAEIYTEWAPLIMSKNLGAAKNMLEAAVRSSSREPAIASAAKRNLAVVLFRDGWKQLDAGRTDVAFADFDRASRDPRLLEGTEPETFQFSLALAHLEQGDEAKALSIFDQLAREGKQASYLQAPYSQIGNQFFSSYARYRSGNVAMRRRAAAEFQRMMRGARGKFASKLRELVASANEYVAYDYYRAGKSGAAARALQTAAKYGGSDRIMEHNQAVLAMKSNPAAAAKTFARLDGNPREALINLGVTLERQGKSKEAYQAWMRARARGARGRNLDRWIDAKKRIFGY